MPVHLKGNYTNYNENMKLLNIKKKTCDMALTF